MQRLVLYLVVPEVLLLFAAQLTVVGGMRLISAGGYSDPFAPYEAMMPEQPAQISGACSLLLFPAPPTVEATCLTDCHECAIGSVVATIYAGRIREVWFYANRLYVGDVVEHWGRPDGIVHDSLHHYLLWDNGLRVVIDPFGPVGPFNYMKFVERVLVFREPGASSG